MIQIGISDWPREGQRPLISYTLLFFLLLLKFDSDVMIKLGRAARLWNGPSLRGQKWRNGATFQNKTKWLPKQNSGAGQACRWDFKPFICEMRLREYKSTLIDKGLNYFISVKLLILETIVFQRPWSYRLKRSCIGIRTFFFSYKGNSTLEVIHRTCFYACVKKQQQSKQH